VSIESAAAGTQIYASNVTLPKGAELVTDPEALVVAVNESPTAQDMEGEAVEAAVEAPAEEAAPAEES
jgi:large subunit ribosomal protein L25